ncbi:MAG: EF-hand domain-containing protein [Prochlorotrichaceae cyanobacterium]
MDIQAIEQAFLALDTNNNGFLEIEEIRSFMHESLLDISDADLEEIINKVDINADGKIDIHEFKKLLEDF